jgi:glyoxylase-like metal-dependent hydrolase (beta-lactamase superfamily II)
MVRADRMLEHGDLIDVPGLALRAIWTPGHTPGHLCFHDETHDLLLTGDHILPRITPNVSSYDLTSNPLDDYLASLAKLRGIQPREVLPAHEYRFTGWTPGLTTWPSITGNGWPRPWTSWSAPGLLG